MLSEAQDAELWARWKPAARERGIDLQDDMAMLDLAMDLSEEMSLPLSVVWAAIQGWIAQGLV